MTQLELVTELRDILLRLRNLEHQLHVTVERVSAVQEQLEADDRPKTGGEAPAQRTHAT